MTKAQKNHMKKWIDALRSGEYKKGAGRLISEPGTKKRKFCAMGVACDIFLRSNKKSGWKWDNIYFTGPGGNYWTNAPVDVTAWLGMDSNEDQDQVVTLNDGDDCYETSIKPHSFKKIADYLEKKYLPKK